MLKERWSEHKKALPDLKPEQNVCIQNQQSAGKLSKRWDQTGFIIENDGHDKYTVKWMEVKECCRETGGI